jgi:hypothetical protein
MSFIENINENNENNQNNQNNNNDNNLNVNTSDYDINKSIEDDKEINFLRNIKKRKFEKDNKTNNEEINNEEINSSWVNKGIMGIKKFIIK